MKKKTMYMHTINGSPAEYRKRNGQITFLGMGRAKLVESLKQIRREQALTVYNRVERWGFIPDLPRLAYGYIKVEV